MREADAMLDLDHVEAFVAIARCGSFTEASSVLHLSQPAISRRIALLEHELGAPLFERLGRSVVLTEAGRVLLPRADALLAAARDAVDAVDDLRGTARGTVTLALVGTLASTQLGQRLRAFHAAHPAVDLRLRTALSVDVSSLVLRGDAVFGVRYDADARRELVCTTLYEERLVVVCPPGHRLAGASRVTASMLAGERWLTFPPRADGGDPYSRAIERELIAKDVEVGDVIAIDSLTAQKRMVEAGFGLAFVPESSIVEELGAGTLRTLGSIAPTIPVVLIQRRTAYLSGAMLALRDLLAHGD